MLKAIQCHKCGHNWSFEPPMGRRDSCPKCHSDARVCLNCRFFDQGSYRECREEQAEWVKEKEKGKLCSYFDANDASGQRGAQESDARSKLDALFGKQQESQPSNVTANISDELAKFLKSRK